MEFNLSLAGGLAAFIGAVLAVAGLAGIGGILIPGILLFVVGISVVFFALVSNSSNET